MLKYSILIFELFFLSFISCQRYYAFIETLFVIDTNYFPKLSEMEYEDYVRTIVDAAHIVEKSILLSKYNIIWIARFFNHIMILIFELKSLFQRYHFCKLFNQNRMNQNFMHLLSKLKFLIMMSNFEIFYYFFSSSKNQFVFE